MPPSITPFSGLRIISRLSSWRTPCCSSQIRPNHLLTHLQNQQQPRIQLNSFRLPAPRFHSTATSPASTSRPLTDRVSPSSTHKPHAPKPSNPDRPEYEMTFTCTPCSTRSTHRISKQGYHKGSVLATCPSCKNRHVISDHLNIFGDKKFTIEDIMREQGQLVKKGTLSEGGDLEFWADGTTTPRAHFSLEPESEPKKLLNLNEGLAAKEKAETK